MNMKIRLKGMLVCGMAFVMVGALSGCSVERSNNVAEATERIKEAIISNPEEPVAGITDVVENDVENDSNVAKVEPELDEVEMLTLPEGIRGQKAETEPNQDLQQLIMEYYEIPEEYLEATRYYYNYIDLNEDGVKEIFTLVMGPYTSGTGGSSALWVVENDGVLHVNQDFTLMNEPIIVSDTVTNGVRELIVPYYGGGANSQYSLLTCSDGEFSRVADGKIIDNLDGVTGDAIIANDIWKDMEVGIIGLNMLSE